MVAAAQEYQAPGRAGGKMQRARAGPEGGGRGSGDAAAGSWGIRVAARRGQEEKRFGG